MQSFLSRKVSEETLQRHSGIKLTIKNQLIECIKELQAKYSNESNVSIESNDITYNLLGNIEAIFIHGLKDSFLGKLTSALGGGNPSYNSSKCPEPNFWLYLLIFSHKEIIDKINKFHVINTDVGRCRSWIRVVLNEGSLSSFLSAMISDINSTRHHYHSYALLRDSELSDIIIRYLRGLEVFSYNLACNSGLLNRWQTPPLITAGLYTPLLGHDVISTAMDAALMIEDDEALEAIDNSTKASLKALEEHNIHSLGQGYISRGLLNEEEALRIIFQNSSPIIGSPSNIPSPKMSKSSSLANTPKVSTSSFKRTFSYKEDVMSPLSKENQNEVSWSIYDSGELQKELREEEEQAEEKKEKEEEEPKDNQIEDEEDSIFDLEDNGLQDCVSSLSTSVDSNQLNNELHLSGFIDAWNPFGSEKYFDTPSNTNDKDNYGFVQCLDTAIGNLTMEDSTYLMSYFDKISYEEGLEAQNFECFDCSKAIGAIFGPYKVCSYTKKYYCTDCHKDQTHVLPTKVVFNWDLRKYPVSMKAKTFLSSIHNEPIINIKSFNVLLFSYVPPLDEIYSLRQMLYYAQSYLSICTRNPSVKENLHKLLYPHIYYYTDVDLYSLHDLESVHSGSLRSLLKSALKLSLNHIRQCLICTAHGWICELCQDKKPIYPFDLFLISQCKKCFTVFHKSCAENMENCPKCDRREARHLNWHVTNIKMSKNQSL